ncbi:MAG TPA: Shedu immune nuclease family protein [Solirubrobacteraceae bacterium]|jgi:hypothetical protein
MANDRIETTSVSRDVVETDPIVLRETPTRRLVFLPTIVDRDRPLRGCFVYQRCARDDDWEDVLGENFNSLKSDEGWALELHSDELANLMDGLLACKQLYERHGIRWGEHEFIDRDSLPQIVHSLIDSPDGELAEVLATLQPEAIVALGRKVDLSQLDALLDVWLENGDNADEAFWQKLLAQHAWVFSQLTGSPVVVLQERAYVGGKGINNRGGGEVDFLVRNSLTHNVAFVEIKTPTTPICAAPYRTSGAFSLHKELSGGVVQVLGYRESFEKTFNHLRLESGLDDFPSYNPRCILIAGSADALQPDEARSCELFRNALSDGQVWTFDEVVARLRGIREALAAPLSGPT